MPLQQFDPPANVNDLSPELRKQWGLLVNSWLEKEIANLPAGYSSFFFNELQHPESENGSVASITWEGFPRFWKLKFPTDEQKRWEASEKIYISQGVKFRYQDEYLEWLSFKKNNKLEKIVFTCEGPEYWDFIAKKDEELLLKLYRQYASMDVELSDLFIGTGANKRYNPSNKWNIENGIIHLTQPNNTLTAEVNLAARAAILMKKGTVNPVTNTHDLICCSGFGDPERFSDPTIGAAVNSIVRQKLSVTLNNPIGLYISKLKTSGIEVPGGFQVKDFWQIIRGDKNKNMILRAEFKAPEGSGIDIESVKVGGKPLKFGAQLAEMIEMVIYGKAFKMEDTLPPSEECKNLCEVVDAFKVNNFSIPKENNNTKSLLDEVGLRMMPFEYK